MPKPTKEERLAHDTMQREETRSLDGTFGMTQEEIHEIRMRNMRANNDVIEQIDKGWPDHQQNDMLSKENRFSKGVLPADTTEKVLEVEDGIVTKKEVDGTVYLRKKCARFGTMFWEAEGTPFYTSMSSETYWCS